MADIFVIEDGVTKIALQIAKDKTIAEVKRAGVDAVLSSLLSGVADSCSRWSSGCRLPQESSGKQADLEAECCLLDFDNRDFRAVEKPRKRSAFPRKSAAHY